MDMQGTPIGSTNQGMKNTTDPSAQQPNPESSGPVAADSLAAESYRTGGGYGANPNAAPSGVSGSKSTLNNTDTSAATELGPTPDAAEREAKDAWRETAELRGTAGPGGVKYPEGLGGQPEFPGSINPSGYAGGPSGAASGTGSRGGNTGANAGSGSGSGSYGSAAAGGGGSSSSRSNAGAAPSSVVDTTDITGGVGGQAKPKGKNLTEGGFEGEATQLNYEIGSKDDPGRAALQGFQEREAASGVGTGPRQGGLDNETKYDALGSDQQA